MIEIELEKQFLVRQLPADLEKFPHKEIVDVYVPEGDKHPCLRLRKKGNSYEMTKKVVNDNDRTERHEHTIKLTPEEYEAFKNIPGKRVSKIRYEYPYKDQVAEISVFTGDLSGLALVDVEFKSVEEKSGFGVPDFCLQEVTHEEIFAGGMLCGKKYADIEQVLNGFGYKKLA